MEHRILDVEFRALSPSTGCALPFRLVCSAIVFCAGSLAAAAGGGGGPAYDPSQATAPHRAQLLLLLFHALSSPARASVARAALLALVEAPAGDPAGRAPARTSTVALLSHQEPLTQFGEFKSPPEKSYGGRKSARVKNRLSTDSSAHCTEPVHCGTDRAPAVKEMVAHGHLATIAEYLVRHFDRAPAWLGANLAEAVLAPELAEVRARHGPTRTLSP
eukprot:807400-Prorocentrum_minimum.AAC.2